MGATARCPQGSWQRGGCIEDRQIEKQTGLSSRKRLETGKEQAKGAAEW